ncbi:hypothetical protein Poli38472_006654 [Pythium oligandrum]|uniref:Uncharacterized protein n=1 Tax=Pythium oligandrum TaxID=41045 RepID=A0A8K1C558_PYTOL|nr:hypothetical protein Poli38472_006654 [Pythium oligandrum]|eukprot:TMW56644.1 hypothetical protein Poli38472_006654 [Pythium oligandrum]
MEKTLVFVKYAYAGDLTNLLATIKTDKVDPNVQDRFGMTALHWASYGGKLDCVQELLKAGASVTIVDQNGRNALHHACRKDHDGVVRFLLDDGKMDINAVSESKDTPLHKAVTGQSIKCIEILLQLGADPHLRNDQNRTPLEELDADTSAVKDEMPEPVQTARLGEEIATWRRQSLTESKSSTGRTESLTMLRFVGRRGSTEASAAKYTSSGRAVAAETTLVTSFRNRLSEFSSRGSSATDLTSHRSSNGAWASPASPKGLPTQSETDTPESIGRKNGANSSTATVFPLNLQSLNAPEHAPVDATASYTASQQSIPSLQSQRVESQDLPQRRAVQKKLKSAGKRVIMMLRVKKNMTGEDKRQLIRILLEKRMKAPSKADQSNPNDTSNDRKPLVRFTSGVQISLPPNY